MRKSIALAFAILSLTAFGASLLKVVGAHAQGEPMGGKFQFMLSAEQHLAHANAVLKNDAGHHFYGHKQRAIDLINQAFQELQAGVREYRKRGPAPVNEGSSGMTPVRNYRVTAARGDPTEFAFMHQAMRELHDAQWILVKEAEGRFYGHKRRAVDLIARAMDELHDGMQEYKAKGPAKKEQHEEARRGRGEEGRHEHGPRMNPTPQPHPTPGQTMRPHSQSTPGRHH
jgi:hypothetical protein